MPEDYLSVNGVDGATGRYLLPSLPLHSFAQAILGEDFAKDQLDELRQRRDSEQVFGPAFGTDPEDLAQVGWAIVAAQDTPADVLEALDVLCELRETQAGNLFQRRIGIDGYRSGQSKRQFLAGLGMASGAPANPAKFPYYVLLVGDPEQIPFEFQYQLDVQYAVGRLHFDTAEEYARYADAVVAAETHLPEQASRARVDRVALFAPENRADRATALSARHLVVPLADEIRPPGLQPPKVETFVRERATKDQLLRVLCGPESPGLLFTASHGVGLPRGHPRQRETQGALLCQDWPGPVLWNEPLREDFYVAANDIPDDAPATPTIVFSFACYGAGTPPRDGYAQLLGASTAPPADAPFVARLPQRLLAHPRAATLAFVGHVDRAWGCSFVSPQVGASRETFWSAIQALLSGRRVGWAMEYFDDRYAALAAELGDTLDAARDYGQRLEDAAVASLWTENNDARSYVVLGDPAVRLTEPAPPATSPGDG